jgi:tetratricopeptide (TPR) repeat protein
MEKEDVNNLLRKGIELIDYGNFEGALRCFDEATQLDPNDDLAFCCWGLALSNLAQTKKDETLFSESFVKFDKATQLNPNDALAFYLWGYAISEMVKIMHDEKSARKTFTVFYTKSDCFKKLNKDILEILVLFGNKKMKETIEIEMFYPLLNLDTDDGQFFNETTKNIDESELDNYKKAYILSIIIISQLHVNDENEKFVATYRDKKITQKILFEDQNDPKNPKKTKDLKFRLNAINYSNDPTEGEILFDYLFDKEMRPKNGSLNREYSAFAGCFIFNHDSLNHFRLYGKEEGREGTGLSLVFRGSFFSEKAKMAMKQPKTEDDNTNEKEEKHTLFRCIYIDPETRRVETVGHKEEYLFFRDKENGETDDEIIEKWKDYNELIADIIENVRKGMKNLQNAVQGLDQAIVGQLLINLRYLTKHIAFKEEQECRIVKIYRLDDERIKTSDDFKQMYVEYQPKVSNHVKKIYFGPKADGMEMFQDMLIHKGLTIPCEKSKNPLA